MKLEKLTEGMEFKSYPKLCEFLEVKVYKAQSDSQKAQFKQLDSYCKYHKEGRSKIIIDKIYEMPKIIEDKRKDLNKVSNNSKFVKDIEALLLHLLSQSRGNNINLSSNMLFQELQMININYSAARKNVYKLSEITNIAPEFIFDFFNFTNSELKTILETSLNSLQRRSLIFWNKEIMVCTNYIHRIATDQEKEVILKLQKETLKNMGYDSLQSVFLANKWSIFKRAVNSKLYTNLKIDYFYNSYKINYNHENILDELEHLRLTEEEKTEAMNRLNDNTIISINKVSTRKHNNAAEKIDEPFVLKDSAFGKVLERKIITHADRLQADTDYLVNNNILSNTVISKEASDLRKELYQTKHAN